MKSVCFPLLLFVVLLAGCASSPYTYHVTPTPIKQGETRYALAEVDVDLTLGHGAKEGDTQFVDQATLTQQFVDAFTESLAEKGILADSDEADAELKITVQYQRNFNYGGNALNNPEISHSVQVLREGESLASFGRSRYTLKRSMAANIKISAFKWKADEELQDVKRVAGMIVDDIYKLGR